MRGDVKKAATKEERQLPMKSKPVELSDADLESVAGGTGGSTMNEALLRDKLKGTSRIPGDLD